MIRRADETRMDVFSQCHGGVGDVLCQSMLNYGESELGIGLFHHDFLAPGVTIGEHTHRGSEEIYYLTRGECTLYYDGVAYPMRAGDFSLVTDGHAHGIANTGAETAELIVVGVSAKK